ncbi:MAG: segregation/condensation protein A [Lachnospiraceae bacterium]|nr:segregation/condensation protein A [Lachnospiraceae bacterium]
MIDVRLEAYEGPLDLLLGLIEKNKVDIYDIPIAEITDQYMAYVEAMEEEDLDTLCEFLLLASTLLDIKARMLLPKEQDENGEEIDPRSELVERLIEHQEYKRRAGELKDYYETSGFQFYREESLPEEVKRYEVRVDPEELLSDVTLRRLQEVFLSVLAREEDRIDPVRSRFGDIKKDPVRLSEKLIYVFDYGQRKKQFTFRELLSTQETKSDAVVTFLALLELIRIGRLFVSQEQLFDEISLRWNDECDTEITKEDMMEYD